MEERITTDAPSSPTPKKENFFAELFRFTVFALVVVVPIRMFIAQPFIVQGASMEPTFETGEYLIVDQVTYRFEEPARGDIIIFRYPKDPSKFFIKRVIGLPGDTVTINRDVVTIKNSEHPDGFVLDEPYTHEERPTTVLSETLGEHEFFVMGDNRDMSSDSRVWGVLPEENIVGRAIVRLLPFGTIGLFPGAADEDVTGN